jgi:hypothetical protein
MTGDLLFAWDEKTNSRQPIGYSVWDGKDGLLPDRPEVRDSRFTQEGFSRDCLPSYHEAKRPRVLMGVCACGRAISRRSGSCVGCYRAGRRAA